MSPKTMAILRQYRDLPQKESANFDMNLKKDPGDFVIAAPEIFTHRNGKEFVVHH
jgi:hypothetical protein